MLLLSWGTQVTWSCCLLSGCHCLRSSWSCCMWLLGYRICRSCSDGCWKSRWQSCRRLRSWLSRSRLGGWCTWRGARQHGDSSWGWAGDDNGKQLIASGEERLGCHCDLPQSELGGTAHLNLLVVIQTISAAASIAKHSVEIDRKCYYWQASCV
jgi:hypothetical protein